MPGHPVLDKVYDPREVEPETYALWERSGAFRSRPDGSPRERTFTIVIPPPNVTGALHLGHALNNTLQDILIRYHRMRGFNTLWQPGTDHAGIATQAVVERRIREQEGKTRHELGRDELVKRIWQWKEEYEKRIISQLKLMGCSCDWERNRFTLDEGLSKAVRHMFFRLFKDGLIFRGKRLVNWDTQLQTAVSDDEVYYDTVQGHFWYFKYPIIPEPRASARAAGTSRERKRADTDTEPEFVLIATTRPETMLGDTAVAVHPDPEGFFDRREQELKSMWDRLSSRSEGSQSSKERREIEAKLAALEERRGSHLERLVQLRDMAKAGRKVMLPLVERPIPLICDEWADPTLGTGCVKITPAHDPNDYEVGLRHKLPMINVLTPDGKVARIVEPDGGVNPHSGNYEGLEFTTEARNKVVADMESRGLLERIEDHETEVGHSDRSKLPIEPYLSDQWFIRTEDIPEPRASARAEIRSEPEPWASARAEIRSEPEPRASARAEIRSEPEPRASARAEIRTPDLSRGATLLTWTTYGTWLPGDRRGFVSRTPTGDGSHVLHNLPGEPYDADEPPLSAQAADRMEGTPIALTREHASIVLFSIAGACERHAIEPLAVAIMSNHVHVVCQSDYHGRELLQILKGNASRELNKKYQLRGAPRWWTKSGSRRRIKPDADLTAAIEYVKNQEHPLLLWSFDMTEGEAAEIVRTARAEARGSGDEIRETARAEARGSGDEIRETARAEARGSGDEIRETARAEARGSGGIRLGNGSLAPGLGQAAIDAVQDGRIKVFPARYAKSYLDWLGEKRDWCISRQLWWGHRIPVWRAKDPQAIIEQHDIEAVANRLEEFEKDGKAFHTEWRDPLVDFPVEQGKWVRLLPGYWCPSPDNETEFRDFVEPVGFEQDPDVLDTWFSSALWPFSTLGWPEETEHLKQYYPASVLCTSRDIITNWVARMVMFGLYAIGRVPFDHVYIHPKILDGRGETMSKSKGNGVDPVDIIHTHGADAMRYSLADMTTETQDIRMPVEYVCPHCGGLVDQIMVLKAEEQVRKSRGDKLDRKLQPADCARVKCTHRDCGRQFATQWADEDTKKELGLARETSDKFDIGRNFCNKLWNAARFAFMNLKNTPCHELDIAALPPEDRWVLARLSQTIRRYHRYLLDYQFSASVRELREFFWDSLCDWYIELTKPRLAPEPRASARAEEIQDETEPRASARAEIQDETQPRASARANSLDSGSASEVSRGTAKQVLAFCLDQVLRLWHPTIPFITERLWRDLNQIVPRRGIPPVAEPSADPLLATAKFPPLDGYPAFDDDRILRVFTGIQQVVRAVRDLRSRCNVSPKSPVTATVVPPEAECAAFEAHAHVVLRMANVGNLKVDPHAKRPPNAGSVTVGSLRVFVHDVSDDEAERTRTVKELEALEKQIAGKEAKLSNEKFVANAKPEIVAAERGRLNELIARRKSLQKHLAELGEEAQ